MDDRGGVSYISYMIEAANPSPLDSVVSPIIGGQLGEQFSDSIGVLDCILQRTTIAFSELDGEEFWLCKCWTRHKFKSLDGSFVGCSWRILRKFSNARE